MKNLLPETVEVAGEVVHKRLAGHLNFESRETFTGDPLLKSEVVGSYDNSIETKFEGTAQVDGLTVWTSNGEVPFADMLLDFVQIGAITMEQVEFSLRQKQKDQEASLATLFKAKDGNIYLGEGALNYRDERLAKLENV